jgi:hypothetical protein
VADDLVPPESLQDGCDDASSNHEGGSGALPKHPVVIPPPDTNPFNGLGVVAGAIVALIGYAVSDANFHKTAQVFYFTAIEIEIVSFSIPKKAYKGFCISTVLNVCLFIFLIWHIYSSEPPKPTEVVPVVNSWQPPEIPPGCTRITLIVGNPEGEALLRWFTPSRN